MKRELCRDIPVVRDFTVFESIHPARTVIQQNTGKNLTYVSVHACYTILLELSLKQQSNKSYLRD